MAFFLENIIPLFPYLVKISFLQAEFKKTVREQVVFPLTHENHDGHTSNLFILMPKTNAPVHSVLIVYISDFQLAIFAPLTMIYKSWKPFRMFL